MSLFAQAIHTNPATHMQVMHSMMAAGAHGAARSAWIEINRPLTALAIGQSTPSLTAASGSFTVLPVSLPIGMDIKSITANQGDIDAGWQVVNFTFGTLNLVNPQGQGPLGLSMFSPFLEHVDRLAPWILSKTKVDVQVSATLYNAVTQTTAGVAVFANACFRGFSLNAFQEEQVCAIQTRIEPTDRNVGNAELINHFRTTIGTGLGLSIPSYQQGPGQWGRATIAPHGLAFSPSINAGQMHPLAAQQLGIRG